MLQTATITRTLATYIVVIVLCSISPGSFASVISITQPFNDTLLCKGNTFRLPVDFVSTTYYDFANEFFAELSDASGSFSSPTVIGYAQGANAPYITCTIAGSATAGAGYRIRLRTTIPAEISGDNGHAIRISPYPSFSLSSNSPTCAGTTLTLRSTLNSSLSPVSYSWTGPLGFVSTLANPTIPSAQLNAAGYYTLTATYYGCSTKDSTNTFIVEAPTKMTIRSNSPVCVGEELNVLTDCSTCLLPGITCTYSIKLPGGGLVNNNNILIKNVPLSALGKYIVSITVSGCTIKDSIKTDVKIRPDSPSHTVSSPKCLGDTLRLDASSAVPGVSFLWRGPNNFSANTANVIIPNVSKAYAGQYSVYAYLKGCASIPGVDSVIIGDPIAKPTITGKDVVCKGDTILLNVVGAVNQLGSFEWSFKNTVLATGDPLKIWNVLPYHSGFYKVTQKFQGCTSKPDSFEVLVPDILRPVVAGNNDVCLGQTLKLHINDQQGAIYNWKGPAMNINGQDAIVNNVTYSDSGRYIATVSVKGCSDTTNVHVRVLPLPTVTATDVASIVCDGDTLRLSATSNVDTARYAWTGPNNFTSNVKDTKFFINATGSTVFYVRALSGICSSLPDSVVVNVKERPEPVVIEANNTLTYGQALHLSAYCPTADVAYSWSGPSGYYAEGQKDTVFNMMPLLAGTYIAMAKGTNGCASIDSVLVKVSPIQISRYNIYPNPNTGRFTVFGELTRDAAISFDIVNGLGRSVYQGSVISQKNSFKIDIDIANVPSGVYYMHMVNGNKEDNETAVISIVR